MFANQADKTTAIDNAKQALEAAKQADSAASTPETVQAVKDAEDALATAEAGEVAPVAPVANGVSKKAAYAGSSNVVAASKHNSWGQGVPRGTYSDAIDEQGRLETFGFQKDNEGNLVLGKDGLPVPLTNDGRAVATGRFIINLDTNGRYKVYNSMLTGLTPDQRTQLTNPEAEAVVFEETELEIKAVQAEGRTSFVFEVA